MSSPASTAEFSIEDLTAVANCLNVVCNILDLSAEFHSLVGASVEDVRRLHERLLALCDTPEARVARITIG